MVDENTGSESGLTDHVAATEPPPDSSVPQTETERTLHALWCGILELDEIACGESFFMLGGGSIQATRLASQVKDMFGCDISVRTVFEAPTIMELAKAIEAAGPGTCREDRPRLLPRPR